MKLNIDFERTLKDIKPMHAVGQPPMLGSSCDKFAYLRDASIPYARLHDVGGIYGGARFVDIQNVFPCFDADESDPASYDFEYTDHLIKNLMEYGCEPIYRLGVTIENDVLHGFKPRYIDPPRDYEKWARICERIIRHYNEGWADGFKYGIKYWEIWNEPENGINGHPTVNANQMWTGSDEEYFRLYAIAAKHLKACFGDSIKVGGYGSSGFYALRKDIFPTCHEGHDHMIDFFHGFMKYIKKENAPIDFFSWHHYEDADSAAALAEGLDKLLSDYGYEGLETHLNEWNTAHTKEKRGTSYAVASTAAMMIRMQYSSTYMLNYYDARIGTSVYGGMFDPLSYEPNAVYYPFVAFGEMYKLGKMADSSFDSNKKGLYALAATDGNGKHAVLLANTSGGDEEIVTGLMGFDAYLIDKEHYMTGLDSADTIALENDQTVYLKNF